MCPINQDKKQLMFAVAKVNMKFNVVSNCGEALFLMWIILMCDTGDSGLSQWLGQVQILKCHEVFIILYSTNCSGLSQLVAE